MKEVTVILRYVAGLLIYSSVKKNISVSPPSPCLHDNFLIMIHVYCIRIEWVKYWTTLPPHYAIFGQTLGVLFKSCPMFPKFSI